MRGSESHKYRSAIVLAISLLARHLIIRCIRQRESMSEMVAGAVRKSKSHVFST